MPQYNLNEIDHIDIIEIPQNSPLGDAISIINQNLLSLSQIADVNFVDFITKKIENRISKGSVSTNNIGKPGRDGRVIIDDTVKKSVVYQGSEFISYNKFGRSVFLTVHFEDLAYGTQFDVPLAFLPIVSNNVVETTLLSTENGNIIYNSTTNKIYKSGNFSGDIVLTYLSRHTSVESSNIDLSDIQSMIDVIYEELAVVDTSLASKQRELARELVVEYWQGNSPWSPVNGSYWYSPNLKELKLRSNNAWVLAEKVSDTIYVNGDSRYIWSSSSSSMLMISDSSNKVDKDGAKVLSDNNFSQEYINIINQIPQKLDVITSRTVIDFFQESAPSMEFGIFWYKESTNVMSICSYIGYPALGWVALPSNNSMIWEYNNIVYFHSDNGLIMISDNRLGVKHESSKQDAFTDNVDVKYFQASTPIDFVDYDMWYDTSNNDMLSHYNSVWNSVPIEKGFIYKHKDFSFTFRDETLIFLSDYRNKVDKHSTNGVPDRLITDDESIEIATITNKADRFYINGFIDNPNVSGSMGTWQELAGYNVFCKSDNKPYTAVTQFAKDENDVDVPCGISYELVDIPSHSLFVYNNQTYILGGDGLQSMSDKLTLLNLTSQSELDNIRAVTDAFCMGAGHVGFSGNTLTNFGSRQFVVHCTIEFDYYVQRSVNKDGLKVKRSFYGNQQQPWSDWVDDGNVVDMSTKQDLISGTTTIDFYQDTEPTTQINGDKWLTTIGLVLKQWSVTNGGQWVDEVKSSNSIFIINGDRYLWSGNVDNKMTLISKLYQKAAFTDNFISSFLTDDFGFPIFDFNGNLITTLTNDHVASFLTDDSGAPIVYDNNDFITSY